MKSPLRLCVMAAVSTFAISTALAQPYSTTGKTKPADAKAAPAPPKAPDKPAKPKKPAQPKKADAKKADPKKAAKKPDARAAAPKQEPKVYTTGPRELRDKDGNVIPTSPDAYNVDSALPPKPRK